MSKARLRKTFQYPADDSDEDDTPKDLDEEEQEKFIERLRKEDMDRNELYKRILISLPIVAAFSFLPNLMTSAIYQAKLTSCLCITSLLITAYTLYFIPTAQSSGPFGQTLAEPDTGPLRRYIEPANGLLSILLGLSALVNKDRSGVPDGFWLQSLLPIVSFAIVTLARRFMGEIDVGELEKLKYGYKGA